MNEFLTEHFALAALIVLALAVGLATLCVSLFARRSEKRQVRALNRLRHDSGEQAETMLRLGENLNAALRQMENLSDSMENRQDRIRRTLDERMELMNQANDRRLEQMQELVSGKLDGRLSESFKVVNGELANVHRGLGELRQLSLSVTDLRKMLGGVKTRGIWGEVQLKSLLTQLYAPEQLVENCAIPALSQNRVEFALRLPTAGEEAPLLPIDSKFPQEDYLRLIEAAEAGDAEGVKRCAAQLERAVLEQAKRIHDKYIQPPQTTDFAVMFLPTESLYAEVARRDGLIERVQDKYRVLVSGPATLCALLTSLQMGLKTVTLEKRSGEVLSMLSGMKQDFARFDESIQRMRQRLNQTEAELDALEQRARKVVKALDKVES